MCWAWPCLLWQSTAWRNANVPVHCSLLLMIFLYIWFCLLEIQQLPKVVNRLQSWLDWPDFSSLLHKNNILLFLTTPTAKLLCLLFDKRLSWILHFSDVKPYCNKTLLGKTLISSRRGADRTCMQLESLIWFRNCPSAFIVYDISFITKIIKTIVLLCNV